MRALSVVLRVKNLQEWQILFSEGDRAMVVCDYEALAY